MCAATPVEIAACGAAPGPMVVLSHPGKLHRKPLRSATVFLTPCEKLILILESACWTRRSQIGGQRRKAGERSRQVFWGFDDQPPQYSPASRARAGAGVSPGAPALGRITGLVSTSGRGRRRLSRARPGPSLIRPGPEPFVVRRGCQLIVEACEQDALVEFRDRFLAYEGGSELYGIVCP